MKRRTKVIIWTVAGLWLTVLMALLSPMLLHVHRETKVVLQTFTSFGNSLVRQDFPRAYQFCGDDFRMAAPYEDFVKAQQDLQTRYGVLQSVNEAGYDITGEGTPAYWHAVISADLVYRNRKIRFQFELHKEHERWVAFGYRQI
jgi:hypothetical protein